MTHRPPDKYEILETLGKGSFGEVFKVMKRGYPKPIALKVVDVAKAMTKFDEDEEDILAMLDHEVKVLNDLSEQCKDFFVLCYLRGTDKDPGSFYDYVQMLYYIETEYINGQEMFDWLKGKTYNADMLYYYLLLIARDVAYALKYIHQSGYIHNDVKLENIIINLDTMEPRLLYSPTVIDLGLACQMDAQFKCRTNDGTPLYFAPEFYINKKERLPASDMWALGFVLYTGASGNYPFKKKVASVTLNKDYPRLNTTNELLNEVVNGLLQKDPKNRLTPDQIIYMLRDVEKLRPTAGYDLLEESSELSESSGLERTTSIKYITKSVMNDYM